MRRSTSPQISTPSATFARTRSIWHTSSALPSPRWHSSARSRGTQFAHDLHDRRRFAVQDGRPRPDYRRPARWSAGLLLGVSGISSDMRTLEQATHPAPGRRSEFWCYGCVASRFARRSTRRLNAVVFHSGIGGQYVAARADLPRCREWLGVRLRRGSQCAGRSVVAAGTA